MKQLLRNPLVPLGLAVLALVIALVAFVVPPANAYNIEPPSRSVDVRKITYAEPAGGNRAYVELNDGSTWNLPPCPMEDSNHCYWHAAQRGDGRGRDFVALGNRAIYIQDGARDRVRWT